MIKTGIAYIFVRRCYFSFPQSIQIIMWGYTDSVSLSTEGRISSMKGRWVLKGGQEVPDKYAFQDWELRQNSGKHVLKINVLLYYT